MDHSSLAANLRNLRAEREISLTRLSQATGISTSFLSLLEQGRSDVTISRLLRLSEFYGVEMADLLTGSEAPSPRRIRVLSPEPENLIRFDGEQVEVHDLSGGGRWAMAASVSIYQAGSSVLVSDTREQEALFFVLGGRFDFTLEGEPSASVQTGEGVALKSHRPYRIHNSGDAEGRLLSVGLDPQAL